MKLRSSVSDTREVVLSSSGVRLRLQGEAVGKRKAGGEMAKGVSVLMAVMKPVCAFEVGLKAGTERDEGLMTIRDGMIVVEGGSRWKSPGCS